MFKKRNKSLIKRIAATLMALCCSVSFLVGCDDFESNTTTNNPSTTPSTDNSGNTSGGSSSGDSSGGGYEYDAQKVMLSSATSQYSDDYENSQIKASDLIENPILFVDPGEDGAFYTPNVNREDAVSTTFKEIYDKQISTFADDIIDRLCCVYKKIASLDASEFDYYGLSRSTAWKDELLSNLDSSIDIPWYNTDIADINYNPIAYNQTFSYSRNYTYAEIAGHYDGSWSLIDQLPVSWNISLFNSTTNKELLILNITETLAGVPLSTSYSTASYEYARKYVDHIGFTTTDSINIANMILNTYIGETALDYDATALTYLLQNSISTNKNLNDDLGFDQASADDEETGPAYRTRYSQMHNYKNYTNVITNLVYHCTHQKTDAEGSVYLYAQFPRIQIYEVDADVLQKNCELDTNEEVTEVYGFKNQILENLNIISVIMKPKQITGTKVNVHQYESGFSFVQAYVELFENAGAYSVTVTSSVIMNANGVSVKDSSNKDFSYTYNLLANEIPSESSDLHDSSMALYDTTKAKTEWVGNQMMAYGLDSNDNEITFNASDYGTLIDSKTHGTSPLYERYSLYTRQTIATGEGATEESGTRFVDIDNQNYQLEVGSAGYIPYFTRGGKNYAQINFSYSNIIDKATSTDMSGILKSVPLLVVQVSPDDYRWITGVASGSQVFPEYYY